MPRVVATRIHSFERKQLPFLYKERSCLLDGCHLRIFLFGVGHLMSMRFFILVAFIAAVSVASPQAEVPAQYFCGVMSEDDVVILGMPSIVANVTLYATGGGSGGNYSITATSTTRSEPSACVQAGSYTYDMMLRTYSFVALFPPSTSNTSCANNLWQLNFTMAHETHDRKFDLVGFNQHDHLFQIKTYTDFCFARVPSGEYCGSALDVPATLSVYSPNIFFLNVNASTNPCLLSGQYLLNSVSGEVAFELGSSTCNEFFVITNVTYVANPQISLTFSGSDFGIGFTAVLTAAQCSTKKK